jgi:isopenicillin-N epimerase
MGKTFPELRRALRLPEGIVNLNAGTVSPTCGPAAAAAAAWRETAAGDPIRAIFREGPQQMEAARRELATAFRCSAEDLLLVSNASYAINTVLRSFPWQAGDEILVSDQEYAHYWALLRRVEKATGAVVKILRLPLAFDAETPTPVGILTSIGRALGPKTRALFLSHVTSPLGLALPMEGICALARARGVTTIVDGAHAAGLVDVDLGALQADFYAANLHKWMMGVPGAAFLHVRHAARLTIEPLMTFSHYEYAPGDLDWRPTPDWPTRWALSHEYQGTRDLAPFAAIPAMLAFHAELGRARAAARWRALRAHAERGFAAIGYAAASPAHPELQTAMLSLAIPGVDPARFDVVGPWLSFREEHGIEVAFPAAVAGAPALLRVSTAWFNTEAEIDRLVAVVAATDFAAYSLPRTPT